MFTKLRHLPVFLAAVLLSGCANLAAIEEFGRASADAAGYARLSDEYAESALVKQRYTMEGEAGQRALLDAEHQKRKAQAVQLQLQHRALASYMEALADLAGEGVPVADDEIGGMVDAAVGASYLNEASAAPLKTLAQALTSAALDGYRQRELKQLIAANNAPIQAVLASLIQSVQAFDASLKVERAAANRYYRSLHARARENEREPVAAEMIWGGGQLTAAGYDERDKAIAPYAESLRAIAAAHQALYDGRERISDKQVLAQLRKYTRQIRSAYRASRSVRLAP